MRIAMMTNNYKPFVGGVPISIERLADSLRDLGHSVYVFAPDYKSPVDDDEYTFRFPTMKHKIAGAIPIPNLIYGYVKNAISTLDIDLIHFSLEKYQIIKFQHIIRRVICFCFHQNLRHRELCF